MKYLASILSIIFQPTLAATLSLGIFHAFFPHLIVPFVNEYFIPLFLIIFIGTYILPSLGIVLLKISANIESYQLDSKTDRTKVSVLICAIWICVITTIITKFPLSTSLNYILFSQIIIIISVSILNYFYKFSLHTFSISFVVILLGMGIYYSKNEYYITHLYAAIIIAGLVGWARMILQKHTPTQIIVGYISGAILAFCVSLFL